MAPSCLFYKICPVVVPGDTVSRTPRNHRQPALEEGAPDDRALEPDPGERVEVLPRPDAARGQDWQTGELAHAREQPKIRAGEGAVAIDRGAQKPRHTGLDTTLNRLLDAETARPLPPRDGDPPIADVYGHNESPPERLHVRSERAGSRERRRPNDHPGSPRPNQGERIIRRADAARGLNRHRRYSGRDLRHKLRPRASQTRSLKIHDMKPRRPHPGQPPRKLDRVTSAHTDTPERPTLEPNGLAT